MNKTLMFFAVASLLFSSCSQSGEDVVDKGQLNPDAYVSIKAAPGTKGAEHATAREIVTRTTEMNFHNEAAFNVQPVGASIGFNENQRDTVNNVLKMWGTSIISNEGEYVTEIIDGHDFILRESIYNYEEYKWYVDTIAYIPNAVIQEARVKIKAAYDEGDYTEVYKLYDSAITFTPITGAEWRRLKADNKN